MQTQTNYNTTKKVHNLDDIRNYRTKPLHLPVAWNKFLGDLPSNAQWTIIVYGHSFGGKTSFILKFAQQLIRNGKLLYINAEESLNGGTLQEKIRNLNISSKKISFFDDVDLEDIKSELRTGKYKFVVFDSLSKIAKTNKISALDVFNIHKEFPNINFIFILFTTKDGKTYKGESDLIFLSEITIEIKNGVADCSVKNRYKKKKINMQFDIFKN